MALKLVTKNGKRVPTTSAAPKPATKSSVQPPAADSPQALPDSRQAGNDLDRVDPAPLWDEGISSYLLGEYQQRQRPLNLDDLRSFTVAQAIRISDILETLFLLAMHGEWTFTKPDGTVQTVDAAMLDRLYARGRLAHDELDDYDGEWRPGQ